MDARDGKRLLVRKKNFLDRPGVYVLYRDDQPYYIGKTQRALARRIWAHANRPMDRYYNFWNLFSAFVVEDKQRRNELEGILIAAMPTANSASPRLGAMRFPKEVANLIHRIRQNRAGISLDKS